jgi:hypothetical protein
MMMVMLPESPVSWPVPEPGTTVTVRRGTPFVIVPLCWSANVPVRPSSVPMTRSKAGAHAKAQAEGGEDADAGATSLLHARAALKVVEFVPDIHGSPCLCKFSWKERSVL